MVVAMPSLGGMLQGLQVNPPPFRPTTLVLISMYEYVPFKQCGPWI